MKERNILDLIKSRFEKEPKHIFLEDIEGQKFTFFDLYKFVLKLNNYFTKKNIKTQDKVVVVFENSLLLSLLFLGITSTQRIFVPINPSSGKEEFNYILEKLKPSLIITEDIYKKKIKKKFDKKTIKIKNHKNFLDQIYEYKDKTVKSKNKKNISEILFTSGSTGKPKAIILTHDSIMNNLLGIYKQIKFKKNKNYLVVTPVYHNNGQFIPTLIPLLTYGRSIPTNSLTSIDNFWNLIKSKSIDYSSVMVTHINYLYYHRKPTKNNLEALFCGGAKLDDKIQKKFNKFFKVKVLTNYGLTESSSIVASETLKNFNTGSAGKPLFNNDIKIKKKINEKYGEILIKGKNIFKNYYGEASLTKEKIRNGWFHSGDLGYFDKKKNLVIKDRIDNMFVVSGENIYPNEIENYANNYPGIKISFVAGIKDKITSKKIIMIYEGKKKIFKDKLLEFLSKKISRFKLPKKIWHISELNYSAIPKAPNGKILRKKFNKLLFSNKLVN